MDEDISRFYANLIKKHGRSYKALDWGSRKSQYLRFREIYKVGLSANCSLLDVGCGLGDLYQYLLSENRVDIQYSGIDLTSEMIDVCKSRFPDSEFMVGDIANMSLDKEYDYIVASGLFTFIGQSKTEEMHNILANMFSKAKKAVAFNSLSSWAPNKESDEFYADPAYTLVYCHNLTSKIVLNHAYMPHDFTVYLYR